MVDMKKFGDELVDLVKAFVSSQMGAVLKRIDTISQRLDELPRPDVEKAAAEAVAQAMAKVELPKDGKDADPEQIKDLVKAAVAEIPAPKDGASVTVEDVAPLIAERVEEAVKALPAAKDGKDADPEAVAAMVRAEVAKIPAPEPGKSITVEDVQPLLAELVGKAIDAIEKPKNGKDADPLDHEAVVKDVLAAVRVPEDGKSVTPADLEPMLEQMVAKAVDALPKPQDGKSVPADQVQKMIDEAVIKAVAAIPVPKDGERGLDALDIDILPAINETRRYARGTYASHKGGIWVARRSTEGMDGWECIVEGDHDDEIELADDLRTFKIRRVKSSGRVIERSFAIPALVDRGVFKEGAEYQAGDVVTWAGSIWIAQEKTASKPDGGEAWRLSVKRGRDGRDGVKGDKGDRGAEGRAGRDLTQKGPDGSKW